MMSKQIPPKASLLFYLDITASTLLMMTTELRDNYAQVRIYLQIKIMRTPTANLYACANCLGIFFGFVFVKVIDQVF